jgi:hypothetical protein
MMSLTNDDPRTIGFIILRHVNSELTNKYWINCYECIRHLYAENLILIIDDDSDNTFLTNEVLYKTTIINSEYPKRGELLPYIYYLQNKLFDTAVILHDSVFINDHLDLSIDKYKLIWEFEHFSDSPSVEIVMIKLFNDDELVNFFNNQNLWKGCFGGMSIITFEYLYFVNNKYNLSKLLDCIVTRYDRMCFERVIGCLLQKEQRNQSLLGNIHKYCPWGITTFENRHQFKHLTLLKVWTGR